MDVEIGMNVGEYVVSGEFLSKMGLFLVLYLRLFGDLFDDMV